MRPRCSVPVTAPLACLIFLVAHTAAAQTRDAETRFGDAVRLLQSGHTREAVPILESLAADHPKAPNLYWNLAQAEAETGAHGKAVAAWREYRRLEPNDWRGLEKLIQSEHAAGEHAAAETDSVKLVQWWKNSTDKELKTQKRFCREVVESKAGRAASFQEFEIAADSPVYYTFAVQAGDGAGTRLILSGNPKTDEKLRKKSRLRDGETILILSRISAKSRETFRIYRQVPAYADLRKDALAVLNGNLKPVSGISVSEELATPTP